MGLIALENISDTLMTKPGLTQSWGEGCEGNCGEPTILLQAWLLLIHSTFLVRFIDLVSQWVLLRSFRTYRLAWSVKIIERFQDTTLTRDIRDLSEPTFSEHPGQWGPLRSTSTILSVTEEAQQMFTKHIEG